MRLGIFAKTFPGATPVDVLAAARDAGYEAVHYNMACSGLPSLPAEIAPEVIAKVRRASLEAGVGIAAVSATYNMIHPDRAVREAGRHAFAIIAATARAMGTDLVTVCTGSRDASDQWRHHPDNASPEAWRDMCAEFGHLIEIAERHDIRIGVEPELANVVADAPRARAVIDQMQSDRIQIVLDPANLFEIETPQRRRALIEAAIDLLGPDIALAHAKDRHEDGRFAPAGDGVIDFGHFVAALRRAGFGGTLVTHGLDAADAPRVSRFLKEMLAQAGAGA